MAKPEFHNKPVNKWTFSDIFQQLFVSFVLAYKDRS